MVISQSIVINFSITGEARNRIRNGFGNYISITGDKFIGSTFFNSLPLVSLFKKMVLFQANGRVGIKMVLVLLPHGQGIVSQGLTSMTTQKGMEFSQSRMEPNMRANMPIMIPLASMKSLLSMVPELELLELEVPLD